MDVTFSNADTELRASIHLPAGNGPFPGAVIVHGSGSSDRSNPWTSAYVEALVARGVAVIHPDKRGSGASGGDWMTAAFEDLAQDAVAAMGELLSLDQVDRVGMLGFSQGGHIAPLAAARDERVAFAASLSGSVVPMMEQIGDEMHRRAVEQGAAAAELDAIGRLHAALTSFAAGRTSWNEYSRTLGAASERELADSPLLGAFPNEESAPIWSFLRSIATFDPLDYWLQLRVPAFFLYGGLDENVDVTKTVARLQSALDPVATRYVLTICGSNGHAFIRDDIADMLARWIHDRGAH